MADRRGCSPFDPALWLLISIAASWVGVAQLARAAEKANGSRQPASIVHLMTWANATAWIFLGIPHVIRRWKELKTESLVSKATLGQLFCADVFNCRQAFRFMVIALATNYSYIGALHYLAASLNTAVFCSSPVFTLLFSVIWLTPSRGVSVAAQTSSLARSLLSLQAFSVLLTVLGVFFIAEPWHYYAGMHMSSRIVGVGLSLVAAVGTATYQVYFKACFGDSMRPDEVALFLAYMGIFIFVIPGSVLACALCSGIYALQLNLVPWSLVAATSVCSAIFNFLIKFGLSRDTPFSVSTATQIGIPLNLLVDVLLVRASIDAFQAFGTMLMLIAFSLQTCRTALERDARVQADESELRNQQLNISLPGDNCS